MSRLFLRRNWEWKRPGRVAALREAVAHARHVLRHQTRIERFEGCAGCSCRAVAISPSGVSYLPRWSTRLRRIPVPPRWPGP
eukprot:COSAG01_NODE_67_length_29188_cov_1135.609474_19_plen_82_part_00